MRWALAPLLALALLPCCSCLGDTQLDIASWLHALQTAPERAEVRPASTDRPELLELERARFDRLLVKGAEPASEPKGASLVAIVTVDVEATLLASENIGISYLGLERIPFTLSNGRPEVVGPLLPALGEILSLLQRRAAALRDGASERAWGELLTDSYREPRAPARPELLAALAARPRRPEYRPTRWHIRAELDRAEVLEEYQDPTGSIGRVRWTLEREGKRRGGYRFSSGLL